MDEQRIKDLMESKLSEKQLMDTNDCMNLCEDYVSFEIAKLLKEKGFDEEIETLITPTCKIYFLDENSVEKTPHKTIRNTQINIYSNDVSCPTLQMAMKWLREVHNLFIWVTYHIGSGLNWSYEIHNIKVGKTLRYQLVVAGSYETCVENAIKYCLENLI